MEMYFVKEKESYFVLKLVISKYKIRDKLTWIQKIVKRW